MLVQCSGAGSVILDTTSLSSLCLSGGLSAVSVDLCVGESGITQEHIYIYVFLVSNPPQIPLCIPPNLQHSPFCHKNTVIVKLLACSIA
jgi:hypothetical protein